jgi:hypothetical protein
MRSSETVVTHRRDFLSYAVYAQGCTLELELFVIVIVVPVLELVE